MSAVLCIMLITEGYEIQIVYLKKSFHIYVIGFVPASKPLIPIITLTVYISFMKAKCLFTSKWHSSLTCTGNDRKLLERLCFLIVLTFIGLQACVCSKKSVCFVIDMQTEAGVLRRGCGGGRGLGVG